MKKCGANQACDCEMCNSGREERQFALSNWDDKYILWDVDEISAFNKWLDTTEDKSISADFPIVEVSEEAPYLLVYGIIIPNPLRDCDLMKEAEAYKGYGHFTLLDDKLYESAYSDIWFASDKVHNNQNIPCAVLLQTSLDLDQKRAYGFGYTMTIRYQNDEGLMHIFCNIMNRSFALCVKDVVKVFPKHMDDWKKYIDETACIETARGIF